MAALLCYMRFLALAVSAGACLQPLPAAATSPCMLPIDNFGPVVIPVDGATDVPINVTPIVRGVDVDDDGIPLELAIDGVLVPSRREPFETVDGFGSRPWHRLVPDTDLPAGVTVAIIRADETEATFSVGDARDDQAPSVPALSVIGPYSDGACKPFVGISVDDDEGALSLARLEAPPALASGAVLHGLALEDSIIVGGDSGARASVFVASVDLAGNTSDAAAVEVTFPLESPLGCSEQKSLGSPATLGVAALLFVLGSRRRRRRGR